MVGRGLRFVTHLLTLLNNHDHNNHPNNTPTGSAPLAPHVLTFMRVLCACPIHEGYGQTETTAMTTITFPGDWTTGHVGGVAPVCEVRTGGGEEGRGGREGCYYVYARFIHSSTHSFQPHNNDIGGVAACRSSWWTCRRWATSTRTASTAAAAPGPSLPPSLIPAC